MKRYSVNEKIEYSKTRRTPFSYGYRFGVRDYREYMTADRERRTEIKNDIAYNNDIAKGSRDKAGVQFSKGYMCAIRDCAAERKNSGK
ncbi:MAG: hypothetical protein LUI60_05115 [Clostridia bacterium]|nr:hypothetical protein [Clostridia bacterium]